MSRKHTTRIFAADSGRVFATFCCTGRKAARRQETVPGHCGVAGCVCTADTEEIETLELASAAETTAFWREMDARALQAIEAALADIAQLPTVA